MTRKIIRPLVIASAVSLVCQSALADPPTSNTSPFTSRPLHLASESNITSAPGVKPNVLLFIDDSGSMASDLNGNWAASGPGWGRVNPSKFNWPTGPNLGRAQQTLYFDYYGGIGGYFQRPSRITTVIDAVNEVVDTYGDRINWGLGSLWRTWDRNGVVWVTPSSYTTYPDYSPRFFTNASEVFKHTNRLSIAGSTPTTSRYLTMATALKQQIKYRCQKNYIVLLSDGDANITGVPNGYYEHIGTIANSSSGVEETGTHPARYYPPSGKPLRYPYEAGRGSYYLANVNESKPNILGLMGNGVSLFSHILYHADLKSGPDAEGGDFDEIVPKQWLLNESSGRMEEQANKPRKQNIETFTIGFGNGLSKGGKSYLQNAATGAECRGKEVPPSAKLGKCYFEAGDSASLKAAFDKIFTHVSNENKGEEKQVYAPSTPASAGSNVAGSATALRLDTNIWGSYLQFAKLNTQAETSPGVRNPDFGRVLTNPDGTPQTVNATYDGARRILVNSGRTDSSYNDVYDLDGASATSSQLDDFGFGDDADNRAEFARGFVPWYKRSTATDTEIEAAVAGLSNRVVPTYRDRFANTPAGQEAERKLFRQMGDVINAPVVSMDNTTTAGSNATQEFVITAANDGLVYIFRATNNPAAPYNLVLNYLPAGMQRESKKTPSNKDALTVGRAVKEIAKSDYGTNEKKFPHLFLNNGGLAWVKTPETGGLQQQYALVGTMGQGGRGAYALNISGKGRATNADIGLRSGDWRRDVPFWETQKGEDNALGYTLSTPAIGQVALDFEPNNIAKRDLNVHAYAFIANGYKGTADSDAPYDPVAALYVYDLFGQNFGADVNSSNIYNGNRPGQLLGKLYVGSEGAGAGLSTPVLYDNNMDGVYDFAFAGDTNGNMWRFDLRAHPSQWGALVRLVYRGQPSQPITAAPTIYKVDNDNVVVIFGTGSDIYETDKENTERQVLMGVYNKVTDLNAPPVNYNDSTILDQTILRDEPDPLAPATYGQTGGKRVLTNNKLDPNVHKAWRIVLREGYASATEPRSSEKITTKGDVFINTFYITSRMYGYKKQSFGSAGSGQTCNSSGSSVASAGFSWIMSINAATGGVPDADKRDSAFRDLLASNAGLGANEGVVGKSATLASAARVLEVSGGRGDILNTNAQGESLEGGKLASFIKGADGKIKNDEKLKGLEKMRKCLPKDKTVLLSYATEKEGAQMAAIKAKKCGADVFVRVNWREVPL